MSGYEVEHNIPTTSAEHASSSPRRRPDMSTFLSTVSNIDTSAPPAPGDLPHQNAHATPHPSEMAAAYRLLANALEIMRVDRGGDGATGREAERGGGSVGGDTELLDTLIEALMRGADDPPRELEGVPDAFLAELDRVPKTKLKEGEKCPICGIDFLDDKYPLVVRLPCHPDHVFDLDCVGPWLKLKPTCPLDRKVLWKKREPPPPSNDDEDDGEYDDMYA